MAVWDRNKVDSTQLNGGNEYDSNSQFALDEMNAIVNGGLYSQDFAERLADTPDNTLANQVGTAEVEIIDNVVGGKTYKKFKFKNLKGEIGGSAPLETDPNSMQQNGTASVGNSGKLAQSNHKHPSDTTKANDNEVVKLSGPQTILGEKTFNQYKLISVNTMTIIEKEENGRHYFELTGIVTARNVRIPFSGTSNIELSLSDASNLTSGNVTSWQQSLKCKYAMKTSLRAGFATDISTAGGLVKYIPESISTQFGSGITFDTTTGNLTCDSTIKYIKIIFNFQFTTSTITDVNIYKNGTAVFRVPSIPSGSDMYCYGTTFLIPMTSSDTIEIKSFSGASRTLKYYYSTLNIEGY